MNTKTADKLLTALLTHGTVREAAKAAGLSERTAYAIVKDPAFQSRYQAAQTNVLREISGHLKQQMSKAVSVIVGIMTSTKVRPSDRLSAARTVLDYGIKFVEVIDIVERLDRLEGEGEDEIY